eukprot:gnl/MRDRNA2_/MRDRNA2_104887_c0_seq1.p1 gnl/MRDRNA2_/MRDRNA2_104887_c0~~gnl/MRDRNA2_/MRDRNA2_104887_c0_seq1.p1  ORF type:complete len:224 (+),score=24.94 gnl/MRDRNA2_/MRDRNA2_104887_c0_seq1:72-743(+)
MTDYKRPRGHADAQIPVGRGAPDSGVLTGPFHRPPWDKDDPRKPEQSDVPPHGRPPTARTSKPTAPHIITGHAEFSRESQKRRPTPRGHCAERRTKFPELHEEFFHSGILHYPTYIPEKHHKIMSQLAAISIPGYSGHVPGFVAENIMQTSHTKANHLALTARREYTSKAADGLEAHFKASRHMRNHSDGGRNIRESMIKRQEHEISKGHKCRMVLGCPNRMP